MCNYGHRDGSDDITERHRLPAATINSWMRRGERDAGGRERVGDCWTAFFPRSSGGNQAFQPLDLGLLRARATRE